MVKDSIIIILSLLLYPGLWLYPWSKDMVISAVTLPAVCKAFSLGFSCLLYVNFYVSYYRSLTGFKIQCCNENQHKIFIFLVVLVLRRWSLCSAWRIFTQCWIILGADTDTNKILLRIWISLVLFTRTAWLPFHVKPVLRASGDKITSGVDPPHHFKGEIKFVQIAVFFFIQS